MHLLGTLLQDTPGDYPQTGNMSLALSKGEDDKHTSWMINLFSLPSHPRYPFVYLLYPGGIWQAIIKPFFTQDKNLTFVMGRIADSKYNALLNAMLLFF